VFAIELFLSVFVAQHRTILGDNLVDDTEEHSELQRSFGRRLFCKGWQIKKNCLCRNGVAETICANSKKRKHVCRPSRFTRRLPKSVTLKTRVMYDDRLFRYFSNDHSRVVKWIERIMPKVEQKLRKLKVKVNLKLYGSIGHINREINATYSDLRYLGKTYTKKLTSFLTVEKSDRYYTRGRANTGSACGSVCGSLNIVAFSKDLSKSERDGKVASLWAHELGHNIGMSHDDDHDMQTKGICEPGYLMDPHPDESMNTWSKCSNKNFAKFYRERGHTCL